MSDTISITMSEVIRIPFSTFAYCVPDLPDLPLASVTCIIRAYEERKHLRHIIPMENFRNVGHH